MVKKIFKILFPLLSAFIGLLLANHCNIFEFLTFVPKEYKYDVCITVYFALSEVLLNELYNCVKQKIVPYFRSSISVVFHPAQVEPDINTTPTIQFNSQGLAEINMTITIAGKKEHFEQSLLVIAAPDFADIQNNYKRDAVQVSGNKYTVKLKDLFGEKSDATTTQTFRIVFAQAPVDGESISDIKSKIEKKNWHINYTCNEANIKAVK